MTVIDASCMLELLLRGPVCRAIEERLLAHDGALSAPHLLDVEVSQVLRRYWLGGQLLEERGREAIADLEDFPLERYPHWALLPRIWKLRDNVTAYDAAYVALAEALDAPLITCDKKLARSTGHAATIEVF
ncbi:MAG: type II toxin-antitoxin system VapC family toxin [Pirellulales bacterium]